MIPLFKVAMAQGATTNVGHVLRSGYIGQGAKVDEFEKVLQRELSVTDREILTVNSGTSALDLALHLAGVRPGDEVISTAQTCTATNTVIVNRHAHIVWADVDPLTGNIDVADVKKKLSRKTRAIMAVDWGGRPCDYHALSDCGVPVIEDAAHSYLATHEGIHIADGPADYVCWSFQAIKHLTTGDGGAIRTPKYSSERARLLRWYGLDRRSKQSFRCEQIIEETGYKYHMNDIAAAIGLSNIDVASDNVFNHRTNARLYHKLLHGARGVKLPPPEEGSAWWLYTLLVDDRASFTEHMTKWAIEVSPVHARNDRHPSLRGYGAPLPGLDYFSEHEVAIPVGWWLSREDMDRVAEAVHSWRGGK